MLLVFTPVSERFIFLCLENQVFKEKKPSRETFVCGACGQVCIFRCLQPSSLLLFQKISYCMRFTDFDDIFLIFLKSLWQIQS